MMKKLVVFTGAGVSAESGLKTFRDEGGLWNGFNVYEVATPEGWAKNRRMVQEFYNMRRRDVRGAEPNDAHKTIALLQRHFDVHVITQNIDDLHERAGSKNVLHLHGEIMKMRSDKNDQVTWDVPGDIEPDARAADGGFLRPHVVWFGEAVPEMEVAAQVAAGADIFIVIGSSLQVYPAAGLAYAAPAGIPKYLIDPNPPDMAQVPDFQIITANAAAGMKKVYQELAGSA